MSSVGSSNWKQWAQRDTGDDGYQFGDVTRKLMGTVADNVGSFAVGPRLMFKSAFQSTPEPEPERTGSTLTPSVVEQGGPPPAQTSSTPTPSTVKHGGQGGIAKLRSLGSFVDLGPKEPKKEEKKEEEPQDPIACAKKGLEFFSKGFEVFDKLDMPHGAGVLEEMRENLAQLEARVGEVIEFQKLGNTGGQLLQVQVCFGAGCEEPPEWSMGQLFVTTDSLFFKSNDAPPWHIGPIKWDEVVHMQKQRPDGGKFGIPGSAISGSWDVHVWPKDEKDEEYQFTGIRNLDWLQKLGPLSDMPPKKEKKKDPPFKPEPRVVEEDTDTADKDRSSILQADDTVMDAWLNHLQEEHESPEDKQDRARRSLAAGPGAAALAAEALAEAEAEEEKEAARPRAKTQAEEDDVLPAGSRQSFIKQADELPAAEAPKAGPIFSKHLPNATISGIRKALQSNKESWAVQKYFKEHMKSFDFNCTNWAAATRVPGTRMRRLRFRMPLPDDVPKAVKRLVSLPNDSSVTLLVRLASNNDRVVLVEEACTHDVTYGENFWAQSVLVFKADPKGGVNFDQFAQIRWVEALPWYASVLTTYIEMKAKEDAKAAGAIVAGYLEDAS